MAISSQKKAGGSVQKTKKSIILKSHVMKNVTARSEKKLGLAAYTFVMYGKDILELETGENVRDYTGAYKPNSRKNVHKDLENTLRHDPDLFPQLNGGLVVTCSSINIDNADQQAALYDPGLVNGGQTQGEIGRYLYLILKTYEGSGISDGMEIPCTTEIREQWEKAKDELEQQQQFQTFEVRVEILVNPDAQQRAEIAIARNNAIPIKSVSKAAARGQLDSLEKAITDVGLAPLQKRESDAALQPGHIDAVKLLQVSRLFTPDHILYPGESPEKLHGYAAKPYTSANSCLEEYCQWVDDASSNSDAKRKYEATLAIAPIAWKEYERWNRHPKFKGTKIQETYKSSNKRLCDKDKSGNVTSVRTGFLFPVLSALKHFVSQDSAGNFTYNIPATFDEQAHLRSALDDLADTTNYDPAFYGRSKSSYKMTSINAILAKAQAGIS